MIVFRAATALLLGLLPAPAAAQQPAAGAATAAALLAWCEANPQARMCESSDSAWDSAKLWRGELWREGSDPCVDGWEGVTCDASGAVTQL
eukprot:COSAG06_NODE_6881_length_2730_cov_12.025846_2_plen_91_part_00